MITKLNLSQTILNETIMDSMPGMAFIYIKDGQLVAWNKRVVEILGYSKEEMGKVFAVIRMIKKYLSLFCYVMNSILDMKMLRW